MSKQSTLRWTQRLFLESEDVTVGVGRANEVIKELHM